MNAPKKGTKFYRDYRDICYFVDHVYDMGLREDLLKSLGYKIGVNVVTDKESKIKSITIGKRKEYRIQIAHIGKSPLVKCAIVEY